MAFLRALLQCDYEAGRFNIFLEKVGLLAHEPDTPVFVEFDYSKGMVQFSVHRISAAPPDASKCHPEWDDLVSRVHASGGRMEIHRVVIRDGVERRARMFRMRSSHAQVHHGVVALATKAARPTRGEVIPAEIMEGVRRVMEIAVLVVHQYFLRDKLWAIPCIIFAKC